MKAHIIQLEHHDDVVSIADKISWSKTTRVLLVWPKRGTVLIRQMDMVLLQRKALRLGSQLGIVTHNRDVQAMARDAGIAVFTSAVNAQRRSWRLRRGIKRHTWKPTPRQPGRVPEREISRPSGDFAGWSRVVIFSVGIISFLLLVLLFFPTSVVTLHPQRQTQTLNVDVWADPVLKFVNMSGGIPAQWVSVSVDGHESAAASGSTLAANTYATGVVQFSNLTDRQVEVPAGMVVLTLGDPPVRFETQQTVIVPKGLASQVDCPIRALEPGSSGNVGADKITAIEGEFGLRLGVSNSQPVQGGGNVRQPSPTERDYEKLKVTLLEQLAISAKNEIAAQVGDDQVVVDGTLRQVNTIKNVRQPEAGTAASQLNLYMQVQFEALVVNKADIETVARTALEANKPAGYSAFGDTIISDITKSLVMQSEDVARWQINASRELIADYSINELRQHLLGKRVKDVPMLTASLINLVDRPEVRMTPGWLTWMPLLPHQIHVEVK